MASVPTSVGEAVPPAEAAAHLRALARRARAERRPHLRVFSWPGDVLLVGRHHRMPPVPGAVRRLSGGRVWPAGAGFVQVALALPHRSALESDDPSALRAEQVLNRAVRGVMAGLELLGVEPYYPGRDLLTVGGRPIGWISLAVEDDGATLVEAGVAVSRDLSALPHLADWFDPTGAAPVACWQADQVTSVGRERGGAPAWHDVAEAIVEGYRRRFGWTIEAESQAAGDALPAAGSSELAPLPEVRWTQRAIMLGALLAQVRAAAGRVEAVRLAGDVVAPVATMRALEGALAGRALDRAALLAGVNAVLADPAHFLLGARADDVADAVLAGAAA
jgi:lipoate-protein ligase A